MSTLMDDLALNLYRSPSGKRHIGGWWGQVLCGAFVDTHNGWRYDGLTSVRWCARVALRPAANNMCKRCAANYKDVDSNAE